MPGNPDFKELLQNLSDASVDFVVVGAHAVMFYAAPRYTKDLDLWLRPSEANAARVFEALKKFGAPLADLTVGDLAVSGTIFQIGVEPNRIDLMTHLDGLDFDKAWKNRTKTSYDGVPITILGLEDLIMNKRTMGRTQDQIDLENLQKAKTKGRK